MKKVITILTFIMFFLHANANEIYIKQLSGTSSTVTIDQTGTGNTIGDSSAVLSHQG